MDWGDKGEILLHSDEEIEVFPDEEDELGIVLVCRQKKWVLGNEVTYHVDNRSGVLPFLLLVFKDRVDHTSTEVFSIGPHESGQVVQCRPIKPGTVLNGGK